MGRPKNILADTDNTDGRDKRFGNAVVIGRVSEIKCDNISTNVRVIMPDKVDHENNPLITKPVPVLQTASTAKKSFAVPRVGTNVAMIKMPNGTSNYLVIGGFYTTSDPPPVDDPMLDYVEYDDGSTMQFDANNGTLTWKLKGDMNYENEGAMSIKLKGGYTLDIEGDVLIKAPNITLEGAMKFKGDITHTGNINTSGTHTDQIGLHAGGREAELEARIVALEQRVLMLEQRYGS
jgi:phage baseplate assembly protein V